jgi:hypothetical protein
MEEVDQEAWSAITQRRRLEYKTVNNIRMGPSFHWWILVRVEEVVW